jgi:hypothetical protein
LQLVSKISEPPFVLAEQSIVRTLFRDDASTLQELVDHRSFDSPSACWCVESLRVQLFGNLGYGLPARTQLLGAVQ